MSERHSDPEAFHLGEWTIEPSRNRLIQPSKETQLETRAMDVLVHLARSAPNTVSGEALLDLFWSGRIVESSTIHRTISKIRRALGDSANSAGYIETVPKRGYRIIAPVSRIASAQGEASDSASTVAEDPVTEFVTVPGTTAVLIEESDLLNLGRVKVSRVSVRIGRDQDNDLILADGSVSKIHASLSLRGRDWSVEDLGSTNGVMVNGGYVETAVLNHGDVVQLGRVRFRLELS